MDINQGLGQLISKEVIGYRADFKLSMLQIIMDVRFGDREICKSIETPLGFMEVSKEFKWVKPVYWN